MMPNIPPPNFSLPPPGFLPPHAAVQGGAPSQAPPADSPQELWVETKTAEGKVRP